MRSSCNRVDAATLTRSAILPKVSEAAIVKEISRRICGKLDTGAKRTAVLAVTAAEVHLNNIGTYVKTREPSNGRGDSAKWPIPLPLRTKFALVPRSRVGQRG